MTEENGALNATAHAWVEIFVGNSLGNNGWIPVECACVTTSIQADIQQNFGIEDAFHLRLYVDDGSNESLITSLSGLSYTQSLQRHIELQPFAEITNYHVVAGADKLTIRLFDGKELMGKVQGTDPKTDLAVVYVESSELTVATLGDSDKLQVGEWRLPLALLSAL
jgi:S1-C subfamily serine protease